MDGTTLLETLTDDLETELSRLGSSKWLYALTDGEMTAEALRVAAAADAAAAGDRFEAWAADADGPTATLFSDLAATSRNRREIVDAAESTTDPAPDRLYETLAACDDAPSRLGGALGQSVVLDRTLGQMVGFFVGDADPTTASTFRELRSTVEDDRDRIVDELDSVCASDADWERARTVAEQAVTATYEEYVERLEAMGVQPKSVC
jgi:uncharacterized Ntn-hydrolase superfamily protein